VTLRCGPDDDLADALRLEMGRDQRGRLEILSDRNDHRLEGGDVRLEQSVLVRRIQHQHLGDLVRDLFGVLCGPIDAKDRLAHALQPAGDASAEAPQSDDGNVGLSAASPCSSRRSSPWRGFVLPAKAAVSRGMGLRLATIPQKG
jgi:hypothetical protein